ncbi:hypothetical protein KI387_014860, partial [Taxus chinensis]
MELEDSRMSQGLKKGRDLQLQGRSCRQRRAEEVTQARKKLMATTGKGHVLRVEGEPGGMEM